MIVLDALQEIMRNRFITTKDLFLKDFTFWKF
jgi:hypothetical protein